MVDYQNVMMDLYIRKIAIILLLWNQASKAD